MTDAVKSVSFSDMFFSRGVASENKGERIAANRLAVLCKCQVATAQLEFDAEVQTFHRISVLRMV